MDLHQANTNIVETFRAGTGFRAVTLPIYQLSDESLVGYEMLSRGPRGPLEMPEDFFKFAIETDILHDVDMNCFKACVEATKALDSNLKFHINLFPSTIMESSVRDLISLFPASRTPGQFCIEIVEQQKISDTGSLHEKVVALRDNGIRLAIDDVGFGASSLESLIVLEPDIIKIDRQYVTGAADDARLGKQLRRLVKVAEALGAELVAEGVSSPSEVALLLQIGVPYGQGILWGPLPK